MVSLARLKFFSEISSLCCLCVVSSITFQSIVLFACSNCLCLGRCRTCLTTRAPYVVPTTEIAKCRGDAVIGVVGGRIFVSELHQIGLIDEKTNSSELFCGNGEAGNVDGVGAAARIGSVSCFAAARDSALVFVDGENKALRVVFVDRCEVKTIANEASLARVGVVQPLSAAVDDANNIFIGCPNALAIVSFDGSVLRRLRIQRAPYSMFMVFSAATANIYIGAGERIFELQTSSYARQVVSLLFHC